jgi:cold-inducible RNA-binding protein
MGSRLYVGNLPFSADEQQVRELFERNNREVTEVKLITDRDTGRARGFGFVEMGNSEDAGAAVTELDGYSMDGRALKVNEARERSAGGGGGGGGRGGGGGGGGGGGDGGYRRY